MTGLPDNHGSPLIVGGGMAGAALALLLRHHGAPAVTLVESHALAAGEAPDLIAVLIHPDIPINI